MKTVTILLCLLAISLAGCTSPTTVMVWDEEDNAIGVRVGKYLTEDNEMGGSFKLRDDDSKVSELGIYAIHHFPELVEFRNPFVLDFLPETFRGSPYIGAKADYNLDTHNGRIDPIAGIIFEDTIYFEQSLDGDSMIGVRAKFKF